MEQTRLLRADGSIAWENICGHRFPHIKNSGCPMQPWADYPHPQDNEQAARHFKAMWDEWQEKRR